MLSRLIISVIVLLFSATVIWAQETSLAALGLKSEDKPIPLFPSAHPLAEKTQQISTQSAATPIEQAITQENSSEEASAREVAISDGPSTIQPSMKQNSTQQPPLQEHQAITKTNRKMENGQSQPEISPQVTVAAAQDAQVRDLQVIDFVLTSRIVNREPQEALETFAEGVERGSAFARLHANANTEVTFVWYRNNQEYTRYKGLVQATKQWRTFSSVKLRSGDWKVQLLDKNNHILAEKAFSIK